jgi:hypothetical protein
VFTTADTQLSICNKALARCGIKQFPSSLDDGSQEAIQCALFWDGVRQKILAGFPWKFAQRFVTLQALATQVSSVERVGTGAELPFTTTITTDVVGTYNILVEVMAAEYLRASADGGITWGASMKVRSTLGPFPGLFTAMRLNGVAVGGTFGGLPVGSGLAMTGVISLTPTAAWAGLVVGDIYRFTATDGVSPEYTYAYALPEDLLIGRYIWPGSRSVRGDQRVPYKRGSLGSIDVLWADADPAQPPKLIYVEDVIDVSRFPAGFTDALAWRLAYEISGPLKAKVAPADLERAYLTAINEARSVDFIESQEDPPPDSEFISARGYNWSPYGYGGATPLGGWLPF